MAELWDDPPQDDFALPGDEEFLGGAPEAVVEAPAETPEAPPAETPVEEAVEPSGRERDDQGRFVAAEPELILGKFKSREALEQSYQELEKKLGERGDVDPEELARRVTEQLAAQTRAEAPQAQHDPDQLETFFDENPHQIQAAAEHARRTNDDVLLAAALSAWEDRDRIGAKQFEQRVLLDRLRQEQSGEYERTTQVRESWTQAGAKFKEANPDYDKYASRMMELAPEYPDILTLLGNSTATEQTKQQVLTFLYREAQARSSDNLTSAAKDIAREQALEADRAIADATVASSATTAVAETPSPAAQIAAEWDEAERPLRDGWNV